MPFTIEHAFAECDNCGKSTEDEQEFTKVCGICYDNTCPTTTKDVFLCKDCQLVTIVDGSETI